jgi:hypothetical protein
MPYADPIKQKEYWKQYQLKNRNKILKRKKEYYLKNKEQIIEKQFKYYLENKEKINNYKNKYHKKRRQTDPKYKILTTLRDRIRSALKNNQSGMASKSKNTKKLLGCTVDELWIHLEKQFKPGMTRKNHGKWHIDHIIPCSSFDLTRPEEQVKCFHYTNLQPLWAIDNFIKGAKHEEKIL